MGIIPSKKNFLPILNLRLLLGMSSLKKECENFSLMKQSHLNWVSQLEKSVNNHTDFLLPTDAHQCEFGQWYYHYHTEDYFLNFILKQIESPHERLHFCSEEIKIHQKNQDKLSALSKLEEAKKICQTELLPLIDKLIHIYQDVNRGIIITLQQKKQKLGIFVDEVFNIIYEQGQAEPLGHLLDQKNTEKKLISQARIFNTDKIYLEININSLFQLLLTEKSNSLIS